jgi:magnesium transporter
MKFPVNLKPAPDRITTPKEYNLAGWMFYYGQACKPVLEGRGLRNQRRHGPFPSVFSKRAKYVDVRRLHMIRRDLLRFRNSAVPLVEVCRRLEHAEVVAIDAAMQPLFRDVTDHVLRVQEEIDALREVLAFAFEASLMTGQAQQTAITRRLAAWAAILAVPTAIAGIYGMNFEYIPELKWRYGYFLVMGIIGAICGTLYWRFRRNDWI